MFALFLALYVNVSANVGPLMGNIFRASARIGDIGRAIAHANIMCFSVLGYKYVSLFLADFRGLVVALGGTERRAITAYVVPD